MKKILLIIGLIAAVYFLLPSFTSHKTMMSSIERVVKIDEENRCFVGAYTLEWNTNYTADEMFSNIQSVVKSEGGKHVKLLGVYTISFEQESEKTKTVYRLYLKDNHFKIEADYTDRLAYEYFLKTTTKKNPITVASLKKPELQIVRYGNMLMY